MSTSQKSPIVGITRLSVTGMYRKPTHASEMVNQLLLGTPVTVLKTKGSWYYVRSPDGYCGWMDETLTLMDAGQFAVWKRRKKLIVVDDYGIVRATASPKSEVVGDIVAGDVLAFAGSTGNHHIVEYPDGTKGFVRKSLVQPLGRWRRKSRATPGSIVATAKRFLGVPYLWGGTSSKALDCSGLVKLTYLLNGISLPRDAALQAKAGCRVAKESPCAGDLLFFGKEKSISHVGIALDNKTFIHASGNVHISSLDPTDPRYDERFSRTCIAARRILGKGSC